ncbi:Met-10+ like-protein-domain-containing protein [Delphinella strobiligena]|nr:Met-10+ like-protein-domain-containing protein [Delphinella strobiligena]
MAEEMFRPPINRAMRVLDRSFFQKKVPLSAARVLDIKKMSKLRQDLQKSKDILFIDRLSNIQADPEANAKPGSKCILLRPEIDDKGDKKPWSSKLSELADAELIKVIPYEVQLDYGYWTYHDIASAVLPTVEEHDEIPSGFTLVGHVAHLNLREQYLQYKNIIGEILIDKNPGVRTVINKVDDVGEESEYRTFKYEVLAGPDDMDVEIREADCTFRFNYAKVYWNSRLNTEHQRLVESFQEGDAVCDVMAGIGPFAVPAGKKRVFVWANDLNPDSHASLVDAVQRNKVEQFVKPFCDNGHTYIRTATGDLLRTDHQVTLTKKHSRTEAKANKTGPEVLKKLTQPKTFQHYVMNLPATAIEFLPSFIGLYTEEDRKLLPADFKLPMIHCYCFNTKSEDNVQEGINICKEVSAQLGHEITPQTPDTTIYDVRDVAPHKRMFCATFRLPEEVAFRARPASS